MWIWVADCPIHPDFHADHYKKSIVINKVRAHMRQGCAEMDPDQIKRFLAPNDTEMYPAKIPRKSYDTELPS